MKLIHLNKINDIEITHWVRSGKIFIYPTDTLYGLGCNADIVKCVKNIREIKHSEKPFSVIAPTKKWIEDECIIRHSEYLKKLPGPFTLIFEKKDKDLLKNVSPNNKIGIRMPNHPFTRAVQGAGVPFITTTVNITGEPPATSIKDIKPEILKQVDIVIDAGELKGHPSTIIDCSFEEDVKILHR